MKKYILLVLLLGSMNAFCQTVVTMTKKEPKKKENAVIPYDSLYNIRFGGTDKIGYKKDFEKYAGQDIIFYDFGANLEYKADGYINFEAKPTIVQYDTTWLKRRKKIKPSHYTIDTIDSRKYKPMYYGNGNIHSSSYILSMDPEGSFMKDDVKIRAKWSKGGPFTGYATPISYINGQCFTIVGLFNKKESSELYIGLKDKDGEYIYWIIEDYEKYDEIDEWNEGAKSLPIVTKGFIDKMNSIYAEKKFFFIENKKVSKYNQIIVYKTSGEKMHLSTKVEYTCI